MACRKSKIPDCFIPSPRRRQRVIGPFAGFAGCSGSVGFGSKLSTSLLHPSEHVGKHVSGAGSWRAAGGSGGKLLGEGGNVAPQAVSSAASGSSIKAGTA
jgi:hypothetical protein